MKPTTVQAAILVIFTLAANVCFSQQWHPFPGNGTVLYYWVDGDTSILGMRIDSIVQEGNANAFYFNRVDRHTCTSDTIITCTGYVTYGGISNSGVAAIRDNYFGRKLLVDGDSLLFVASKGDTFLLKLHPPLHEAWLWSGSDSIWLDSVVVETIYGFADSVKVFELTDGQKLKLSKTFGIVETFPFLDFCEFDNQVPPIFVFRQFGIPDLGLGRDIPRKKDWENAMQAGDEICFHTRYNSLYYNSSTFTHIVFGDTIANCPIQTRSYMEETITNGVYSGWTTRYPPCTSPAIFYGRELPYEAGIPTFSGWPEFQKGIRIRQDIGGKLEYEFNRFFALTDTCAYFYQPFENGGITKYVEGLGKTFSLWSEVGEYRETNMVGYKMGAEIWGTCPDLHALAAAPVIREDIKIWPNPSEGLVNVEMPIQDKRGDVGLNLFSMEGKLLGTYAVTKGRDIEQIDLGQLPSGIYFLSLESKGAVLGRAKVCKR